VKKSGEKKSGAKKSAAVAQKGVKSAARKPPNARVRRAATPPTAAERARALALLAALDEAYPDAHCELNYSSPHELLIATILSAQCTDVAVNKATPALFARFPKPEDYAGATAAEIEPYVRSLGFFRNKSKAVHLAMKAVVEEF